MKQDTAIKIICTLLVFLFVYAAVSKLADFATFRGDMYNQPLPGFLKLILVWTVPATEVIIAALLILIQQGWPACTLRLFLLCRVSTPCLVLVQDTASDSQIIQIFIFIGL